MGIEMSEYEGNVYEKDPINCNKDTANVWCLHLRREDTWSAQGLLTWLASNNQLRDHLSALTGEYIVKNWRAWSEKVATDDPVNIVLYYRSHPRYALGLGKNLAAYLGNTATKDHWAITTAGDWEQELVEGDAESPISPSQYAIEAVSGTGREEYVSHTYGPFINHDDASKALDGLLGAGVRAGKIIELLPPPHAPARPLPDRLIEDFHDGARGTRDVDMSATVHAIIEDILNSVELAWSRQARDGSDNLPDAVRDYVENHYGEL